MPSGPQRRKKKKNKAKPDTKPHSPPPPHGESDGDQHNSTHPEVKVENSEGSSSGYESLTPVTTQKSAKERLSKIEIDKPRNSPKQAKINIDKAAMMELEPPTVADYLTQPFEFSPEEAQKTNDMGFKTPTLVEPVESVDQSLVEAASKLPFEFSPEETQKANDLGFKTPTFVDPVEFVDQTLVEVATKLPFEFSPEKKTQKANDLGFKTPTFVDPVEFVDQMLVEVASQLNDDAKIQDKDDLAVAETHSEHTVINEMDKPPNLTEQAKIKIKLEPPTVADYLSKPFESSPEKGTHKVEDLGFKTPTFVDPVESVEQSLVEVASQLDNNTKIQQKGDFAAAETHLEHTVINDTDSKSNQLSKDDEVQKLDSTKSKENFLQDSTNSKCPHCGRSGDDEKQPLLASAPRSPEKASWKNCCGIFELFSGSSRN